jgi:hypothetical protein
VHWVIHAVWLVPNQLIFGGSDVGVVDVEDFVELALADSLKEPTPHGLVERVRRFFSSPDSDHKVAAAIGVAHFNRPSYALTLAATMEQVPSWLAVVDSCGDNGPWFHRP